MSASTDKGDKSAVWNGYFDNQSGGLEFIKSRRSIREYTEESVSPEQIQSMLEAAMAAPSGRDLRGWDFVVVTDPKTREALSKSHQFSGMIARAPVAFVICGRPKDSHHWIADCSAATENLLLQAHSMGLGGVWVGVYPLVEREDLVKRVLGLPEEVRVLCMAPVGHPAEERPSRTRFEQVHVHYERWGKVKRDE